WLPREENTAADELSRQAYNAALGESRAERAKTVRLEEREGALIANDKYVVDPQAGTCTCPDFVRRHATCKHLIAAGERQSRL
ncbi:MAG: SWIM zinc finger family protein, partial [Anaerolineae bacterium]